MIITRLGRVYAIEFPVQVGDAMTFMRFVTSFVIETSFMLLRLDFIVTKKILGMLIRSTTQMYSTRSLVLSWTKIWLESY